MLKLLITGASGLVGHACCQQLQQKYEIVGTYLNNAGLDDINWLKLNILDLDAVNKVIRNIKPDLLLHLAWETEYGKYLSAPVNMEWTSATFNLVKSFYDNGGRKAVMSGTCFEYDISHQTLVEDVTPTIPQTLYGISKLYANQALQCYAKANNLPFAYGRIFYTYGQNENSGRLVPHVIDKLLKNDPAICSSGNQIRDYLYIEDVAAAFVVLIESAVTGVVNISSNQRTRIKDIVLEIANQLNKQSLVVFDSKLDRDNEPDIILGENRKLRHLGWHQQKNLSEGIASAIDYYKIANKYD